VTNTGVRGYRDTVSGSRPTTQPAAPPQLAAEPRAAAPQRLAARIASPGDASAPVEHLPRHPHQLPREAVARSQRSRILRAVAASVAANGYAATTVADVIRLAGVSRSTFYELYDGKESAFLDAYAGIELVHRQLLDTSRRGQTPEDMVVAAVRAHLAALASEPDFAWMFYVEAVAAGPRILARRRAATAHFLDVLAEMVRAARALDPSVEPPRRELLLAFVGAARELIATHLLDADAATLPGLEPSIVAVARRLLLARSATA